MATDPSGRHRDTAANEARPDPDVPEPLRPADLRRLAEAAAPDGEVLVLGTDLDAHAAVLARLNARVRHLVPLASLRDRSEPAAAVPALRADLRRALPCPTSGAAALVCRLDVSAFPSPRRTLEELARVARDLAPILLLYAEPAAGGAGLRANASWWSILEVWARAVGLSPVGGSPRVGYALLRRRPRD